MSDHIDRYQTGFVVIPRINFEHFRDEAIYHHLIKKANFKDSTWCERGQYIFSVRGFSDITGWSYKEIRTTIQRLEKQNLIVTTQTKYKGNAATLITIVDYEASQQLENYAKNGAPNGAPEGAPKGAPVIPENAVIPIVVEDEKDANGAPNGAGKGAPKGANRTAFKQQDKQQDKHIKESCQSRGEIISFVDSQQLINRIQLPNRLFVEYFDLVRLQRKSGKIANGVLKRLWDRLAKQVGNPKQTVEANQAIVTYALSTYIMNYGHKPAEYALGIISNTSELEARQGIMKLHNQKQNLKTTWGEWNGLNETSDKQRRAAELDELSL
ncbi:hypothetical protein [Brevibacillus laterosporus]|uniref:hypothetical protein n=1 Tax=Brevibacillus laterosporus TaxID=1465 RepID=UPI000839BF4A|nr:hypothetical protein [Brevibacillus laterosporus]